MTKAKRVVYKKNYSNDAINFENWCLPSLDDAIGELSTHIKKAASEALTIAVEQEEVSAELCAGDYTGGSKQVRFDKDVPLKIVFTLPLGNMEFEGPSFTLDVFDVIKGDIEMVCDSTGHMTNDAEGKKQQKNFALVKGKLLELVAMIDKATAK